MFYVFDHPVVAANKASDPKDLTMRLVAGVIHQVDIVFQEGCDHKAKVQIWKAGHQVWPTNRLKAFEGNATAISFREFHELGEGTSTLTALIWGDGTDLARVVIQIGVLPKRIIQPLSFDELLNAAAGIE